MASTPESIKLQIDDITNLPTLPSVVKFVTSMVEQEDASAQEIGNIISRDQVLSAKLLRMVNSPFYGFPGRISSVTHALVLLGFNVVKGLVLGTAVFDNMGHGTQGLWKHSLGTAVIARKIAKHVGMNDAEEIMVGGLLHDLGKVVLSFIAPGEYEMAVHLAEENHIHIGEAELKVFGVNHAQVGLWVAEQWHLPERLQDILYHHHNPEAAELNPRGAAIIHVADILARCMDYGYPGDFSMPTLSHESYHSLGLYPQDIQNILQDTDQDFEADVSIFASGD